MAGSQWLALLGIPVWVLWRFCRASSLRKVRGRRLSPATYIFCPFDSQENIHDCVMPEDGCSDGSHGSSSQSCHLSPVLMAGAQRCMGTWAIHHICILLLLWLIQIKILFSKSTVKPNTSKSQSSWHRNKKGLSNTWLEDNSKLERC